MKWQPESPFSLFSPIGDTPGGRQLQALVLWVSQLVALMQTRLTGHCSPPDFAYPGFVGSSSPSALSHSQKFALK